MAQSDEVRLLIDLTGEVRLAPSQNALYTAPEQGEGLHELCRVEQVISNFSEASFVSTREIRVPEMRDVQHSLIDDSISLFDYSVSAPSAFNGMHGVDRIAPESRSVETQTDFTSKPPRPPQASLRKRVNLRSRRLAVREFKEAKMPIVMNMITDILYRSNFRGKGCCYWHIGLQSLLDRMAELLLGPCNDAIRPYSGWQCQFCFSLHDDMETSLCEVCFSDNAEDDEPCEGIRPGDASSSGNADLSAQSEDHMPL
jgi:hypothetical protein